MSRRLSCCAPIFSEIEPYFNESGEAIELFAGVLIPERFGEVLEDDPEATQAQYWSRNLTDDTLRSAISRALDTTLRREKIAEFGLNEEVLDDIADTEASIGSFRPDKTEEEAELGLQDRIEVFLPAALTYMLVVVIFGVGNLLLTNTIEERSNKIVEVLLSSVTAEQLMLGKLIGIGAVGLTLPTVFLVGGGLAAFVAPGGGEFIGGIMSALFSTPFIRRLYFLFPLRLCDFRDDLSRDRRHFKLVAGCAKLYGAGDASGLCTAAICDDDVSESKWRDRQRIDLDSDLYALRCAHARRVRPAFMGNCWRHSLDVGLRLVPCENHGPHFPPRAIAGCAAQSKRCIEAGCPQAGLSCFLRIVDELAIAIAALGLAVFQRIVNHWMAKSAAIAVTGDAPFLDVNGFRRRWG